MKINVMKNDDQVSLKQGERELDFSNYGIKILVRFRTGQVMIS